MSGSRLQNAGPQELAIIFSSYNESYIICEHCHPVLLKLTPQSRYNDDDFVVFLLGVMSMSRAVKMIRSCNELFYFTVECFHLYIVQISYNKNINFGAGFSLHYEMA